MPNSNEPAPRHPASRPDRTTSKPDDVVVILPCSSRQSGFYLPARFAYSRGVIFRDALPAAKRLTRNGGTILVMSAKHGLLTLDLRRTLQRSAGAAGLDHRKAVAGPAPPLSAQAHHRPPDQEIR